MPKLSFYEGFTQLTFAHEGKLLTFPHIYNKQLFSNSFSKEEFYANLFDLVAKDLDIPLSTCEIFSIGVTEEPEIPFKQKKSVSLLSLLPENYLFVSHDLLATKGSFSTQTDPQIVEDNRDFFGNCYIYPEVVYKDRHEIRLRDTLILSLLRSTDFAFKSNSSSIILTGDRMSHFHYNNLLTYALCLDLIIDPGVFNLKLDVNNIFPHTIFSTLTSLLGHDEGDADSVNHFTTDVSGEYLAFGTLVNSPGVTECLYKPEYGEDQLITLGGDEIFIVPLEKGASGEIFVKNSQGKTETKVSGGEVGILIDTRDKSQSYKTRNMHIDFIAQYLHKL